MRRLAPKGRNFTRYVASVDETLRLHAGDNEMILLEDPRRQGLSQHGMNASPIGHAQDSAARSMGELVKVCLWNHYDQASLARKGWRAPRLDGRIVPALEAVLQSLQSRRHEETEGTVLE